VDDLYIYEYLNHGNIIVMAKFRCASTDPHSIRRHTRQDCVLTSRPLHVELIAGLELFSERLRMDW
jgi:hypothetical protein